MGSASSMLQYCRAPKTVWISVHDYYKEQFSELSGLFISAHGRKQEDCFPRMTLNTIEVFALAKYFLSCLSLYNISNAFRFFSQLVSTLPSHLYKETSWDPCLVTAQWPGLLSFSGMESCIDMSSYYYFLKFFTQWIKLNFLRRTPTGLLQPSLL